MSETSHNEFIASENRCWNQLSQGQRRLAAIMFTDMVGYIALGQRNETLSLAPVKDQKKLTRPVLARHNGREAKTIGDALLVEFPSPLGAVRCAQDVQRATPELLLTIASDDRPKLSSETAMKRGPG
jgi:adenylate cyclase